MTIELDRWRDLAAALGQSLLDLLGAELDELKGDFSRSGKRLARVAVAFALAAALMFWTAGVATVVLITVLARWLPLWGASATVAGLLLLLAVAAAGTGYLWARSLEWPLDTVRRRLDDHLQWWRSEVAPAVAEEAAAAAAGGDRGEEGM